MKKISFLFWAGMILFLITMGTSAVLYPGGNRFDANYPHYSFTGNFLCDLFDGVAYNGRVNPGKIYAEIGAYTFALTMLLFWNILPNLFPLFRKQQKIVREFGTTAMIVTLFIATPLHDLCINIAVPSAVIAFITAIYALTKTRETLLSRVGMLSVGICVVNYLSLIFRFFPATLPGLQKITLFVFLIWAGLIMNRLRKVA